MELLNALLALFGMGQQEPSNKQDNDTDFLKTMLPMLSVLGPNQSMSNQSTPMGEGMYGPSTHPQWGDTINKYAQQYNLNPRFVEAIMMAESRGNPKATSSAGAGGLMQLMPATAAGLGVKNAYDPEQNIMGGTKYIKKLTDMFGDSPELVAAAYNAGEGNVKKYGNKIPPFKETQTYVPRVTGYLRGVK